MRAVTVPQAPGGFVSALADTVGKIAITVA